MSPPIDYYAIGYLFFRLLPMMTASILCLAPLFNFNLRGFVYLFGIILSTAGTLFTGYMAHPFMPPFTDIPSARCADFALSSNQAYSLLPLDIAVFGFTTTYLFWSMIRNELVQFNIPTLIILPSITLITSAWIVSNSCFSIWACLLSLIVSSGFGLLWGYIVETQLPIHQYFFAPSNRQTCIRKNDSSYSCSNTSASGNPNETI
jgi:hypothetical protein